MRLIRESKTALLELRDKIATRQVIPLIGSGVSAAAGYPTWLQLLDRLHQRIANTERVLAKGGVGGKYFARLEAMPDVLWRAQEYRRLLGEEDFIALMAKVFQPRELPATSPLHALSALNFRHYLTTNYDDLIEQALLAQKRKFETLVWGSGQDTGASAQFVRDLTSTRAKCRVVYLHGRYDDPRSLVLADSDYFKRYVATDETQKRLFAVFLTQSILFVGFSMSDPELTELLRAVRGMFRQVTPWHYAIMPLPKKEKVEVATAYYRYRFGLTPIFYEPSPEHEGLRDALSMLGPRSEVAGRRGVRPGRKPPAKIEDWDTENPDDPNKGKFGGQSSKDGWKLTAVVDKSEDDDEWFVVKLSVTAPPRAALRTRNVKFHLHPSFNRSTQVIELKSGKAELERYAYGAFTVGVVAGRVRLELDLADVPKAPPLFRTR